jgi:hypothetical protein
MNIPRYWARATAEVRSRRAGARHLDLAAWGWSSTGRAEAEQRAQQRLASLVQRVEQGQELPRGYAYGDRPLREEIVLEHRDGAGQVTAILSRNGYGALVLNTANTLFIDVDLPPAPSTGVLSRLFGRARPPGPEDAALPRLRDALRASGGRFRIYRTAAGFRVLGTDRTYDPRAETTQALMQSAGADPAFVHLCRLQECFRARLTPKPWRCGLRLPPGTHPRENASEQTEFARWVADYEQASRGRATCKFIETVAGDTIAPALQPLVERHDELTRADAGLPLA